jgi:chemotaxis signal transduction protein
MLIDVMFFELRGRRCALPVSAVSEVVAMASMTPVPLAPPAIRGIAPLHGQVVPVVDLGVWLSPSPEASAAAPLYRPGSDKVLLVEANVGAAEGAPPVRAALAVDRVMRLGTIDQSHARPPPSGPAFVSATVLDVEGPALLIDAARAVEQVRDAIHAAVKS